MYTFVVICLLWRQSRAKFSFERRFLFCFEFLADAAIAQHGMILVDVHHFAHVLPNSHVSKNAKHHLRCSSTKRQQTIRGTRQRKYWEPPTRRTRRRSERKLCTLFSLLVCSASASLFSLGLRTTFTLVIRQQTTALVHSLKPYLCTATNVHVRTGSSFGPPRIFNISKKLMSPASIAMYCESSTKLSRWCCSQQTLHQNSLLQPHRFILLFTHHQVFLEEELSSNSTVCVPGVLEVADLLQDGAEQLPPHIHKRVSPCKFKRVSDQKAYDFVGPLDFRVDAEVAEHLFVR